MSNLSITRRLTTCFGAIMTVALILAASSLTSIATLSTSLNRAVTRGAEKIDLNGKLLRDTTDMDASQRTLAWRTSLEDSGGTRKAQADFDDAMSKTLEDMKDLKALLETDDERAALDRTSAAVLAWRRGVVDFVRLTSIKGGERESYRLLEEKLIPLMDASDATCEALDKVEKDMMLQARNQAARATTRARLIVAVCALLSLLTGIPVMVSIRGVSQALRLIADQLSAGAESVARVTGEVSCSSSLLAEGASRQAASLQQTAESSQQIDRMARQNAEHTRATVDLLLSSENRVSLANQQLSEMVISIDQVGIASGKISKIIRVIDDIAFQTNILALNAAVEAARAGESGLGFSVVAEEVRSLAQRSAAAARDTAGLIEDSIAKTREGQGKVSQVAASIRAVAEDAAKVKVMADEVSAGSDVQTARTTEISRGIADMEQLTRSTAASAQQSAAIAEELRSQSQAMRDTVERLNAMVGGNDHETAGDSRIKQKAARLPRRSGATR